LLGGLDQKMYTVAVIKIVLSKKPVLTSLLIIIVFSFTFRAKEMYKIDALDR